MAVPIWKYAGVNRNLDNTANYTTGAIPTTGDDALFISDNSAPNSGPNANMTGLTNAMATVTIGDGYTESIGGAGNHAVLEVSGKLVMKGTGTLWLKCGTDGIAKCVLDVIGGSVTPSSKHISLGTTNTMALLFIKRGGFTGENGAVITSWKMGSIEVPASDAYLTLDAGVTISTDGMMWGGLVNANVNVPTLHIHDGEYNQLAGLVSTALHLWGGQVNLKVGGTYPAVHFYDGILDCVQGGGQKVITNAYFYTRRALEQFRGYKTPLVSIGTEHYMW